MFALSAALLAVATGPVVMPPVTGVDGRMHRPLLEAHGKPALFLFISHDCPICNTYAPEIGRVEAKYGGSVAIFIVYADPRFSRAEAAKHAKSFGIDRATLLIDPAYAFASASGATITPEALLYNASSHLAYAGRINDWYYGLGRQRPAPTTHDLTDALDAVILHRVPKPAAGPPVGCVLFLPKKP